ncbi:MAG: phosphoribosylanthranilate isomerase [Chloroflexi bacterium]|nr:phosphoribosylanthranilate isomerase [Chloroflexota bacterium]
MKIKICGLRRLYDGEAALAAGADLVGVVFYPPSPRYLPPEEARRLLAALRERFPTRRWGAVGVFVNAPVEQVNAVAAACDLDFVQLHGTEDVAYCAQIARPVIKALRLHELPSPGEFAQRGAAAWGAARLLIDAAVPGRWGGTGQTYDWQQARPYAREALMAGGLTPDNVAEAVQVMAPWGLDVSSGVEREGWKDARLIEAFIVHARQAAAALADL